jgi:hypothetical protein
MMLAATHTFELKGMKESTTRMVERVLARFKKLPGALFVGQRQRWRFRSLVLGRGELVEI